MVLPRFPKSVILPCDETTDPLLYVNLKGDEQRLFDMLQAYTESRLSSADKRSERPPLRLLLLTHGHLLSILFYDQMCVQFIRGATKNSTNRPCVNTRRRLKSTQANRKGMKLKNYAAAINNFNQERKISPESDTAIAGLGLVYFRQGDIDRGLPHLENAFISPEPRLEAMLALAEIYEDKGQTDKAIRMNKLVVQKLLALLNQRWR